MQNYLCELVTAVNDPRLGLKCRPAMYLAHSILGVVLKAALVSSMPEARQMQEWCCGCVLFAVPHTREESRWTGKSHVEEKKGTSKWRTGVHGQRSVMGIVNSGFVKAVNENEWHIVSVIEGMDVTVGLNAVIGLGERETVVMTEKDAVEVCRFGSRDEAIYRELVAGMRKLEKGSALKADGMSYLDYNCTVMANSSISCMGTDPEMGKISIPTSPSESLRLDLWSRRRRLSQFLRHHN
jgi:hypothetical protein